MVNLKLETELSQLKEKTAEQEKFQAELKLMLITLRSTVTTRDLQLQQLPRPKC